MRILRRNVVVGVAALALTWPLAQAAAHASAGPPGQSKAKGKNKDEGEKKDKGSKVSQSKASEAGDEAAHGFDAVSEEVIRGWFGDSTNLKGLPPGLAKREQLPPGLQRQLEKNGTLPPGLQKKIQPLPDPLESQLPPLPRGTRRIVVGGNVILLDETTSMIIDIIEDVIL